MEIKKLANQELEVKGLKVTLWLSGLSPPVEGFKVEPVSGVASHLLITWHEDKVLLSCREPSITARETVERDSLALRIHYNRNGSFSATKINEQHVPVAVSHPESDHNCLKKMTCCGSLDLRLIQQGILTKSHLLLSYWWAFSGFKTVKNMNNHSLVTHLMWPLSHQWSEKSRNNE